MNTREYEEKTGQSVHSVENQRILGRLVNREVVTNVSMLVSHFAQNPKALNGSDYHYDEVLDLCRGVDYYEAAQSWFEDCNFDDLVELAEEYDPEVGEENLRHIKKYEVIQVIEDAVDDWEEFCRDNDIETDDFETEIYEHWVVTEWFKRRLEQQGEVVGEFFGLDIWGRGSTGQAISMDGVIAEIAIDMEILVGQPYSWEG